MKTIFFIFSLTICFNQLFAEWIPFSSKKQKSKPSVNMISHQQNLITLEIVLHGIEKFHVVENNVSYQKLSLPGYFALNEYGKPYIPKISELLGIPLDATVKMEIIDSTVVVFENYLLYPAQDCSERREKPEFIIDNNFYKEDKFYPGYKAQINKPNVWRDISTAELNVYPVQYNPHKRLLNVFTKIVLEIEYESLNDQIIVRPEKNISKRWDKIYTGSIINYGAIRQNLLINSHLGKENIIFTSTDYELLVIVVDDFYDDMLAYSFYKHRLGLRTKTVKLSEVGITDTQILNYIKSEFSSFNIEYVLLVGDPENLPLYHDDFHKIYGDYWYSNLTLNSKPEISVGRISFFSLSELDHQLNKFIRYQQFPPEDNWVSKSLLIADDDNFNLPHWYQDCKEGVEGFNYNLSLTHTKIFGSESKTNNDIINSINSGVGIVNYRGHGGPQEWHAWTFPINSWTNSEVYTLSNGDKTPIVLSISCNTGSLQNKSESLIEAFLKTEYGAVAAIGATKVSDREANNLMDREFYKAIYHSGLLSIGTATIEAMADMMAGYGSDLMMRARGMHKNIFGLAILRWEFGHHNPKALII